MISSFAIVFQEEGRAGRFTIIIAFLMSCDFFCTVALPHGAVGWSALCNCGMC